MNRANACHGNQGWEAELRRPEIGLFEDAVRGRDGLLNEWQMGIRLTEECPEVFTTKDCWALAQLMSRKPLGQ